MRRTMYLWLSGILAVAFLGLTWALASNNSPRLGLDLQGGASVVLSPTGTYNHSALGQAQRIINNRVNGLGVAGATVQSQGNNIVVELPGVKNATAALAVIGQTAQLQFRPVVLDPSSGQELIFSGPGPSPSTSGAPATSPTTKAAAGSTAGQVKAAAAGSPTPAPNPLAATAGSTAAPSA